jgi:hypothetical protein
MMNVNLFDYFLFHFWSRYTTPRRIKPLRNVGI